MTLGASPSSNILEALDSRRCLTIHKPAMCTDQGNPVDWPCLVFAKQNIHDAVVPARLCVAAAVGRRSGVLR